jgi:hypothetical protein
MFVLPYFKDLWERMSHQISTFEELFDDFFIKTGKIRRRKVTLGAE